MSTVLIWEGMLFYANFCHFHGLDVFFRNYAQSNCMVPLSSENKSIRKFYPFSDDLKYGTKINNKQTSSTQINCDAFFNISLLVDPSQTGRDFK